METVSKTIERVEGVTAELRQEVNKNLQEARNQQAEARGELATSMQGQRGLHEENVKEIREAVDGVRNKQKEAEVNLRETTVRQEKTSEELSGKINKLQEGQKRLQVRIENTEERRTTTGTGPPPREQLCFSGTEPYPMEFLRELEEVQQTYYDEGNVRWISQHLNGDAALWWRLIRPQVSSFAEFQHAFTQKYWDELRQERVRNELEYGRYEWIRHKSMVHYMEGKLLEARHLTPTIPTAQVIRKISKHFGRDIQLATLTRGIRTSADFGMLLSEYETLNSSAREQRNEAATQQSNEFNGPQHYNNTLHNQGHGHAYHYVPKGERDKDRRYYHKGGHQNQGVATLDVVNQGASTSTAVNNAAIQKKN